MMRCKDSNYLVILFAYAGSVVVGSMLQIKRSKSFPIFLRGLCRNQ
jgi:hypothetical protein